MTIPVLRAGSRTDNAISWLLRGYKIPKTFGMAWEPFEYQCRSCELRGIAWLRQNP